MLVDQLYKNDLLDTLKVALDSGTPYLGTSAGSNICGISMGTSNDMPIVHPQSFETLGVLPFNINPHYLDPNPDSKHMGETGIWWSIPCGWAVGMILSFIYYKMGNTEEFKNLLQLATTKDPNNAELQYNLGVIASESDHPEESMGYYKNVKSYLKVP